jgi:methylase of polypeptide subunit release factors
MLALEIGYGQYYKVSQILKEKRFKEELLIKDYKNNVRCILARLKN